MKQVIQLIENKNSCLMEFHNLNEAEIAKFSEGNFNNLERFYGEREKILGQISTIDHNMESMDLRNSDKVKVEDVEKIKVSKLLDTKNSLVTKILSQDLQILSMIEEAKSEIIKELKQVRVARKANKEYGRRSEIEHD